MNKVLKKVSKEMAHQIGYYVVKSGCYYVSIHNYIAQILPKPFEFIESFNTEKGVYIRIKTDNVLSTVKALLSITKEIYIHSNEVAFLFNNNLIELDEYNLRTNKKGKGSCL